MKKERKEGTLPSNWANKRRNSLAYAAPLPLRLVLPPLLPSSALSPPSLPPLSSVLCDDEDVTLGPLDIPTSVVRSAGGEVKSITDLMTNLRNVTVCRT